MRLISVFLRLAAIASFAAMAGLSSTVPASANSVTAQVQHYLLCLDLMFSNPARHARECGPGHEWPGNLSHDFQTSPSVAPPADTPSTCPTTSYVAFVLTGVGSGQWNNGDGWNHDGNNGGCPHTCPQAYVQGSADLAPGIVQVHGCGGYTPPTCGASYSSAPDVTSGIIQVGCGTGCLTSDYRGTPDVSPLLLQVHHRTCDTVTDDSAFEVPTGTGLPQYLI